MLLALGVLLTLLFFGIIWFNNPGRDDFPVQGIDVSNHQGRIDWEKVKSDRVDFVYIKATEGGNFVDQSFNYNWSEARKREIRVGAYHFFTLCKSGEEQAMNFISIVPKAENSLPPAIDLEFIGNCSSRPDLIDFNSQIRIFYDIVKNHYNTQPVIYTTYDFNNRYDLSHYRKYLWIRDIFMKPDENYAWTFWQYSNRRHVNGIAGYVDGNVFFGDENSFNSLIKGDR
jgi:lysozyme